MALPRWIESSKVDSTAMFIAFSNYTDYCMDPVELCELSELYTILHAPYCSLLNDGPWRPCRKMLCWRCNSEWGGFAFRWYDRRWEGAYLEVRRVGSWLPGEEEGVPGLDDDVSTAASVGNEGDTMGSDDDVTTMASLDDF